MKERLLMRKTPFWAQSDDTHREIEGKLQGHSRECVIATIAVCLSRACLTRRHSGVWYGRNRPDSGGSVATRTRPVPTSHYEVAARASQPAHGAPQEWSEARVDRLAVFLHPASAPYWPGEPWHRSPQGLPGQSLPASCPVEQRRSSRFFCSGHPSNDDPAKSVAHHLAIHAAWASRPNQSVVVLWCHGSSRSAANPGPETSVPRPEPRSCVCGLRGSVSPPLRHRPPLTRRNTGALPERPAASHCHRRRYRPPPRRTGSWLSKDVRSSFEPVHIWLQTQSPQESLLLDSVADPGSSARGGRVRDQRACARGC